MKAKRKTTVAAAKESKYLQIAEEVRGRIASGELKVGDKLPSFSQMRAESGIMPATFDRSLALLQQEGLIVRENGRGVFVADTRMEARYVIALSPKILLDKHDPYWDNLLRGIREAATEHRLEIVFMSPGQTKVASRVNGMIVYGGSTDEFGPVTENFPFVSLMVPSKGAYCVASDDSTGAYTLAKHLLELGHDRIAILMTHPIKSALIQLRIDGYRKALAESNIAFDESIVRLKVVDNADDFVSYSVSSYQAMQEWLETDWQSTKCTAIMAYNDAAAVGIIRALREAGLRVPEDISVVGFDGNPVFDFFEPRLTTARVHVQEVGREGTNLLIRHIEGDTNIPPLSHIGPTFVKGESTGPRR